MALDSQQQQLAGVFRVKYKDGIELWAQQTKAVTDGLCLSDTDIGAEQKSQDFFGLASMRRLDEVDSDLLEGTIPTQRRWITFDDYYTQVSFRKVDRIRMAVDPAGGLAKAQMAAAARLRDTVRISGLIGTSYKGKTMTTPIALPNTGVIADGGTSFTLDKYDTGVDYLKTYGMMDPGDRIICLWTSKEEKTFMRQLAVNNRQYTDIRVSDTGVVEKYGLVDFYRIEDVFDDTGALVQRMLPYYATGSAAAGPMRQSIMYVKKALWSWEPEKTDGDVDWDFRKRKWVVTTTASLGASRLMDRGVVVLNNTSTAPTA